MNPIIRAIYDYLDRRVLEEQIEKADKARRLMLDYLSVKIRKPKEYPVVLRLKDYRFIEAFARKHGIAMGYGSYMWMEVLINEYKLSRGMK